VTTRPAANWYYCDQCGLRVHVDGDGRLVDADDSPTCVDPRGHAVDGQPHR
jgi:hypothetical protein